MNEEYYVEELPRPVQRISQVTLQFLEKGVVPLA
jgi:hypothetical protein